MIRLIIAVILLAVGGVGTWLILRGGAAPEGRPPSTPRVDVVTAEQAEVLDSVMLPARLRAAQAVSLSSEIAGVLVELAVDEGARVAAGDLIARLDEAVPQAALREAEVALADAERELTLARTLQERQIGPAERIRQLEAQVATATARVDAARAMLAKSRIVAPFAGRLGLRHVDAGAWVAPGTPIIELTRLDPIELVVAVPAIHLERLRIGQDVTATAPAFGERTFTGTVRVIDPRIDPATASVTCVAEFANPEEILRPGLVVDARVVLDRRQGVRVAEAAVELRGGTSVVYVVSDEMARRRPVVLGARGPGWVEIREGLAAGEQVVVRGLQSLFMPESAVIINESP